MGLFPFGTVPPYQLQAATPLAGYALQNAGPVTVISWTAPNDGKQHRAFVFATLSVTSAQTGGLVNFSGTIPNGGVANDAIFNGGAAVGNSMAFGPGMTVAPGTTVSVVQFTAQTLGAAILNAEIWGS